MVDQSFKCHPEMGSISLTNEGSGFRNNSSQTNITNLFTSFGRANLMFGCVWPTIDLPLPLVAQTGLGHFPQSRSTNLFASFGRINLALVAFDLPSVCRFLWSHKPG